MDLQVVADGRHSVPTQIELEVDGAVRELPLPPIATGTTENATAHVPLHFPARDRPPHPGHDHRRARAARDARVAPATRSPRPSASPSSASRGCSVGRTPPARVASGCRSDLLDDRRPRRCPCACTGASATPRAARRARRRRRAIRAIRARRRPSAGAGPHVLRTTATGVRTGFSIDRLVLASGARRRAARSRRRPRDRARRARRRAAPTVTVVHNGATRMRVHVTGADEPFWLVLGQSQSPGWHAHGRERAATSGRRSSSTATPTAGSCRPEQSSRSTSCSSGHRNARCGPRSGSRCSPRSLCLAIIGWALRAAARRRRDGRRARPGRRRRRGWSGRSRRAAPRVSGAARIASGAAARRAGSRALVVAPWVGVLVALARRRDAVAAAPARRARAGAAGVAARWSRRYIVYLQHHFRFPSVFEWPTLFPLGPAARLARGRAPRRRRGARARRGPLRHRSTPTARSVNEPVGTPAIRDNHLCSRCAISRSRWVAGTR